MNLIKFKIAEGLRAVVFYTFSNGSPYDKLMNFATKYGPDYEAEVTDNGVSLAVSFYFTSANRQERRNEVAELLELFKKECGMVI